MADRNTDVQIAGFISPPITKINVTFFSVLLGKCTDAKPIQSGSSTNRLCLHMLGRELLKRDWISQIVAYL